MAAKGAAVAITLLYEAKTTEVLSQTRTTALQAEIAANVRVVHIVLLDALLLILRDGYAPSYAVQFRGESEIRQPARAHTINDFEMASPFDWVAALSANVTDKPEVRFQWLLSLDEGNIARLLAAYAGRLIDATEGKFTGRSRMASANHIARAVNLDMRQHWEGGAGFFDRLSR